MREKIALLNAVESLFLPFHLRFHSRRKKMMSRETEKSDEERGCSSLLVSHTHGKKIADSHRNLVKPQIYGILFVVGYLKAWLFLKP